MKICLYHPNSVLRAAVRQFLQKLEHVVVDEGLTFDQAPLRVARYRPHLILAAEPERSFRTPIEISLAQFALHVPLVWIPSALLDDSVEDWLTPLICGIKQAPKTTNLVRYCNDQRNVLRDEGYAPFEDGEKRNLPGGFDPAQDDRSNNMVDFARQVERAILYQEAARQYLRQALVTDRGLRVEIAYRAVHGSHKIYWLREHICRWVGVLAHYLPGVEPQYLPPPSPPSPRLDYLFHSPPPESFYSATALLNHGFKPSWMPFLRSVLERKFAGQDESDLLQDTLFLSGLSSLFREIALAQVRVMKCALCRSVPWYDIDLPSRALHRATGLFCDFWNFRHLRVEPHLLRSTADAVVVDGYRDPQTMPVVPPFRHFVSNGTASPCD